MRSFRSKTGRNLRSVWKSLLSWYRRNGRALPWRQPAARLPNGQGRRAATPDDYAVSVSEFMLQQTQVERVIPLFRRFLRRFPDWSSLARARQSSVVRAWKGLGYNLRAVRLKKMAETVVSEHRARLPADIAALARLKGVGPYTARALQAFVHRLDVLAPDTNVRRVLTRLALGPEADPRAIDWGRWRAWERTLPPGAGHDANQALMDVGSTICRARTPDCGRCPLAASCASFPSILKMEPRRLPRQKSFRHERVDALGIPNRIYRGRIIDVLREGPVEAGRLSALGMRIRRDFSEKERAWLEDVLAGLERDGLIETTGETIRLC